MKNQIITVLTFTLIALPSATVKANDLTMPKITATQVNKMTMPSTTELSTTTLNQTISTDPQTVEKVSTVEKDSTIEPTQTISTTNLIQKEETTEPKQVNEVTVVEEEKTFDSYKAPETTQKVEITPEPDTTQEQNYTIQKDEPTLTKSTETTLEANNTIKTGTVVEKDSTTIETTNQTTSGTLIEKDTTTVEKTIELEEKNLEPNEIKTQDSTIELTEKNTATKIEQDITDSQKTITPEVIEKKVYEENKLVPLKDNQNALVEKAVSCEQFNVGCYITDTALKCYKESDKTSAGLFNNVEIKDLDFDKKNPNIYLLTSNNNVLILPTAAKSAEGYDELRQFVNGDDLNGEITHISFAGGALYFSTTDNIIYQFSPTTGTGPVEFHVMNDLSVDIADVLAIDSPNGTNVYFVTSEGTIIQLDTDANATKVAEDVTSDPGQLAFRRNDSSFDLFLSDVVTGDIHKTSLQNSATGLFTTIDGLKHIHSTIDNRVLTVKDTYVNELLTSMTVNESTLRKDTGENIHKAAQGRICEIKTKPVTQPKTIVPKTGAKIVEPEDNLCTNPNMVYDKELGECVCPEGYTEEQGVNGPMCIKNKPSLQPQEPAEEIDEFDNNIVVDEAQEAPQGKNVDLVTPNDNIELQGYGITGGACTLNPTQNASTAMGLGLVFAAFALLVTSSRKKAKVRVRK